MPNQPGSMTKREDFIHCFSAPYRYGFNGIEKDDEIKGSGNHMDFKFRAYDTRLGRFFSVDPLASQYPWNSPYAFAENDIIRAIDLEGLEKWYTYNEGQFYQSLEHDGRPYSPETATKLGLISEEKVKNIEAAVRESMSVPLTTDELIRFEANTEFGLAAGIKLKFLGEGIGIKGGITYPVTSVVFGDDVNTTLGGEPTINGTFAAGPLGGSASKSLTSRDASASGNLSVINGSTTTKEGSEEVRIVIFEIDAAFVIGASMKLSVSPTFFQPKTVSQDLVPEQGAAPPDASLYSPSPKVQQQIRESE